ncbi:hypothetical protein N7450_006193 [Penicillium hetheringtonii]|uniref:Uncharacterized protein n=1 Tax=Penicillium hetheringtonii TaxID=911720 RepID=A0AAD6DJS9_9EURO|nr:hypothetical protein N7450_006193 [Penicillium hetheringtonii]
MLTKSVSREASPSDVVLPKTRKRSCSIDSEFKEPPPKRHVSETISQISEDEASCPLLSCPFSDGFFNDMASAIGRHFPITVFAQTHNCEKRDVLHALHAVVQAPLRNPQPWHEGMSVSEYAQILITDWRTPPKYPERPGNEETSSPLPDKLGSEQSPILIADDEYDPFSPELPEESPPRVEPAVPRLYDRSEDEYGSARRQLFKKDEIAEERSVFPVSEEVRSESGWVYINSCAAEKKHRPAMTKKTPALDDSSDESTVRDSLSPTKQKAILSQEKAPVTRVHCRKTVGGSWIPVHEWIEGYHQPAEEDDTMSGN